MGEIAESVGILSKDIIVANNGSVTLLDEKSITLSKEQVPSNYVMVDGLGVGDVGQIVFA